VTVSENAAEPIVTNDGDRLLIVAKGFATENPVDVDAVPFGVVTVIRPLVAPLGTVVTICDEVFDVIEAAVPLNVTEVAPLSPVPLTVTLVPTGPDVGLKLRIVGLLPTR
jgi:hypothetical protein